MSARAWAMSRRSIFACPGQVSAGIRDTKATAASPGSSRRMDSRAPWSVCAGTSVASWQAQSSLSRMDASAPQSVTRRVMGSSARAHSFKWYALPASAGMPSP